MQFLLLQTFAWMFMVGLLGAMLGCLARRMFGAETADAMLVPAAAATRTIAKGPVVEASKAPRPVTPVVEAARSPGTYSYPVTTVGIPRPNPELVQPQIQKISLPPAAAVAPPAPAKAAPAQASVTIRQPGAGGANYPVTTVGIPTGYTPQASTPPPAALTAVQADTARFARVLAGEGQPRPEPLRPELARGTPSAPSAAATVSPPAPVAPPKPAAPVAAAPAPAKPVASVAPAAPSAPVTPRQGLPNPPIESKPAGITPGTVIGPIASKPAGIPAEAPAAPAAAVKAPVAPSDVPYVPVAAGAAALEALAARAASAKTAAPVAPVVASPAAPAPAAPAAAGDDLMRIRSIDATLQSRLKAAGITRFSEIARWSPSDVARVSQALGLVGRIGQENWIEQAQILATGGETEYSRRRLRGEIPTVAATSVAPPATVSPAANTAAASAAATAAAAAMASAALARAATNVEPAMPAKLVDAIRENLTKPAAPATEAKTADAGRVSRPDLAGLRSVRSEALRDVPASETLRTGGLARSQGQMEDLKRIRGIGVLIEKKLNSLGVAGYEDIANWTNADIDRVSQILDFKGRIERENWVEQARILASGGQTEFSKRVDRGEA